MTIYPWQESQWANIQWSLGHNRLAHALLLTGAEGMGKGHFAQMLITSLLCQNRGEGLQACGECHSCHLYNSENHPDFVKLAPEEAGKQIGIEMVRSLGPFVSLKPQLSEHKCILVEAAHMMNSNAANAFLKTLEEPNAKTHLILVTDQPAKLLPTIRSRCQVIQFAPEFNDTSTQWVEQTLSSLNIVNFNAGQLLRMATGAPLQAVKYAQDGTQGQIDALASSLYELSQNRVTATQTAEQWLKISNESDFFVLDWYYRIVHSQLLNRVSGVEHASFSVLGNLTEMINKMPQNRLFHLVDEIASAKKGWSTQANKQLLLEGLFLRWQNL